MAEYKVLKNFGENKEGDVITTDTWSEEERAARIEDGTIVLMGIESSNDVADTSAQDDVSEVDAEKEAKSEQDNISKQS